MVLHLFLETYIKSTQNAINQEKLVQSHCSEELFQISVTNNCAKFSVEAFIVTETM